MPFTLNEKYILECELELGATLPNSYRNAMMHNNSGEIQTDEDNWELYPIFDSTDKKRISRTCNHIISETKSFREWHNFPENGLAIANNGFGDQLVFLNEGEKFNDAVYFWSHETGELEKLVEDFKELKRL